MIKLPIIKYFALHMHFASCESCKIDFSAIIG